MKKGWKVVVLVLGIVIVVIFALFYLGIIPYFQFSSSYTKVSVPLGSTGSYESSGINSNSKTIYTLAWRDSTLFGIDPRGYDASYFEVWPYHYSVDGSTGSTSGPTS